MEEESEISELPVEDTESKIQSENIEENIKCENLKEEESPELINIEVIKFSSLYRAFIITFFTRTFLKILLIMI